MTSNTDRPDNREMRALKAKAQRLDPIIKIGRAGLTPGLVSALDKALADHELVKVKFTELKDQKAALSEQLAAQTLSFLIWRVGHVSVFFRRKPGVAASEAPGLAEAEMTDDEPGRGRSGPSEAPAPRVSGRARRGGH